MTIYGNEQMNTNCSDHDCNSCAGSSSLQSIFGVHDIDNLIHMHDVHMSELNLNIGERINNFYK
jgi:hypothetical protein